MVWYLVFDILPREPTIYLATSVALAQLQAEDHHLAIATYDVRMSVAASARAAVKRSTVSVTRCSQAKPTQ
ncbi:MAG: hypothetical protein O7I93_16335 [Gemmatimonadetes bacterium]|nr:hypothetical protein [Gemmatimonadota bacterium]